MTDPAAPPVWLLIVAGLVWMFLLGLWVERNRFGGSKDLAADATRLRGERDRAKAEVDERRRAAMPTLTLIRGELDPTTARAVDRSLRRLCRYDGTRAVR